MCASRTLAIAAKSSRARTSSPGSCLVFRIKGDMASYAPERLLKLPSAGWPRVALARPLARFRNGGPSRLPAAGSDACGQGRQPSRFAISLPLSHASPNFMVGQTSRHGCWDRLMTRARFRFRAPQQSLRAGRARSRLGGRCPKHNRLPLCVRKAPPRRRRQQRD
jgi:hypothetical protein